MCQECNEAEAHCGVATGPCLVQVVLAYALSMGQVVLPRSSKESHMKEALDLLHTRRIALEASELVFLASLEGHLPSV
jgi:diketogulonate reductase-like aldo/keto reductase